MSQQINLYEERLRPRFQLLSARNLSVALALSLVVLVVLGVVTRSAAERVEAELGRAQGEVAAGQKKLADLGKSLADLTISPALQAQLDAAHAQLDSSKMVMAQLDSTQPGSNAGFSGIMAGFSRQASSDLWLTAFSVGNNGQEIEIRGRLLDASKLPGYVQRLASEPAFVGRRFDTLDVHSVDPSSPSAEGGAAKPATEGGTAKPSAAGDATLPGYVEFVLRSDSFVEMAPAAGGKK